MKISKLKNYLNSLPNEFDDYDVVLSEIGVLDELSEYRMDSPIVRIFIDDETKEMCIVHEDTNRPKGGSAHEGSIGT